ncbi:acetylajmalan esterase-like [Solanum stenotomum]|uniref:acetylajmalan esterase-like n=1 Tax=Solanum stenotomum TaxID=172797 RepID=UPI0020D15D09|nr:acetylajmalan esterase-like [Solanum stenotomum]
MALTIRVLILLIIMGFVVLQQKGDAQKHKKTEGLLMNCRFDKIYQLGNSISDTGNCLRESLCGTHSSCRRFPYGINFFHNVTGRCSDGMLMIDFIARESGLPFLNPFKDRNADFSHGVNFAVAGATALSVESLAEKNIAVSFTNSTLSVQLHWMSSHFKSISSPEEKLKKSLFLVGEIGGNDFNYGLSQGKSIKEARKMVPEVVQTIIHGVKRVIDFGATRIIIPGNFPIGCVTAMLTKFKTNKITAYDEYHCIKDLNSLARYFNHHLQQAIHEMKKKYPNIILIYGDYYNAYLWLLRNAVSLGFDKNSLQKACCGTSGKYNYNTSRTCGAPGVPVCVDPSTHISWDGIHLTQEAYKWLARWLIDDMLPQLNCQV